MALSMLEELTSFAGGGRCLSSSQGQKCSASSRMYVPSNLWEGPGGMKEKLIAETQKIKTVRLRRAVHHTTPGDSHTIFSKKYVCTAIGMIPMIMHHRDAMASSCIMHQGIP